jgi:2-polyprenyl-6-hydroxyphenyl methylase/3-demethylubiquinone-9 3-methyltransferase
MSNATGNIDTIRKAEADHFGKLAAEWWNPKGSSAMLHRLNPVRLGFIRDSIDSHWKGDSRSVRPWQARRRSMSAAARACCASLWPVWARR